MNSILVSVIFIGLYAWDKTRKFAGYMLPWFRFGLCYDLMRYYPNYEVNAIDVRSLYEAERSLFGIPMATGRIIPGEWFSLHTCAVADLLSGIFYLCWVPVPILFSIWLYATRRYMWMVRFTWAFLLVNLIGFVGYYVHPAAPPWYALQYGFTPVTGTPGNVAGLGRFDAMTGLGIFHGLYGKNANVFAAVPSLHAAYLLVTTIYSVLSGRRWYTSCFFAVLCVGIWWTAVYTTHHYIIDVLLGITTALVGVGLFEWVWHRIGKHFTFE